MEEFGLTYQDVLEAKRRIEAYVRRTPLEKSDYLSDRLGCTLFMKNENLQKTGSFKIRGALNKLLSLDRSLLVNGVVTASAGNHAQGVAYSAKLLNIGARVYMPENTPYIKVEATKSLGASVELEGETFEEAYRAALRYSDEQNTVFVHPFDDRYVAAGQGTLALEILEELPDPDVVLVPVGGGGLIAGVATAIKKQRPSTKVVGVQAAGASSVHDSFKARKLITSTGVNTFAEGIATGGTTTRILNYLLGVVDDFMTVTDDEIALAIITLMERTKLVAEGAGAAALAACMTYGSQFSGKKVVCLVSGGNIDMLTMERVLVKGLRKAGRRSRIFVRLKDRPGQLSQVLDVLSSQQANVLSVFHERESLDISIGMAEVTIEVEMTGPDHERRVFEALRRANIIFDEDSF
jgi:threonine dehydratase